MEYLIEKCARGFVVKTYPGPGELGMIVGAHTTLDEALAHLRELFSVESVRRVPEKPVVKGINWVAGLGAQNE